MNLSYHDKSVDHISLSYNREHSIITLSQNDQNLDPPFPPCSHLFDFGIRPPASVQNFPNPTLIPYKNKKSCDFIVS